MAEKVNVKFLKQEFDLSDREDWEIKKVVNAVKIRGNVRNIESFNVKNIRTGDVYAGDEGAYLRSLLALAANSDSYHGKLSGKNLVSHICENSRYMDSVRDYFGYRKYKFNDKPYKGKSTSEEKLLVHYLKEYVFEYTIPSVLIRELLSIVGFKYGVNNDGRNNNHYGSRSNAIAESPYILGRRAITRNTLFSFRKFFDTTEDLSESPSYFAYELKKGKNYEVVSNDIWSWLAIVGNGLSFHKFIGKDYFTKRESHLILNGPDSLNLTQSIIFALAYAKSGDYSYSLTLSRLNKLALELERTFFNCTHKNALSGKQNDWAPKIESVFALDKIYLCYLFDVIKVFASDNSGKSLGQLEEIVDYMIMGYWPKNSVNARLKGEKVPVFGRGFTMNALYRDTISWHYELASEKLIGSGSWEGLPIPDSTYIVENDEGHKASYSFFQILTAKNLQAEGRTMRHCVSGYADKCRSGGVGVFSMQKHDADPEDEFPLYKRLLTLEIDGRGNIIQVKGRANRDAKSFENRVIRIFAKDNMLGFRR